MQKLQERNSVASAPGIRSLMEIHAVPREVCTSALLQRRMLSHGSPAPWNCTWGFGVSWSAHHSTIYQGFPSSTGLCNG